MFLKKVFLKPIAIHTSMLRFKNTRVFNMAFRVRPVSTEDGEKIWEHVNTHFRKAEPLSRQLKLGDSEMKRRPPDDKKRQNVSFIAVDELDNVVGACLNELVYRTDPIVPFKSESSEIQKIIDFIDSVNDVADVFNKYPNAGGIIHIHVLSVDPTWRRKGIAEELIKRTREVANDLSVPLLQMDCTSFYSAQLALKMGFKCIYKQNYLDYLVDGKPVFLPDGPHQEVGIYVQNNEELPSAKS